MDKETRRPGTGSKSLADALGAKAEADSGQTGDGGVKTWVNERGEVCVGSKCFSLAFREGDEDVTIRIDKNECGADMLPVVDSILSAVGRGGRTIYETKSLIKK